MPEPARGFTVADVAARYRVSPDKVRQWVRRGELAAVNVASSLCGRPQLRVSPRGAGRVGRASRGPACAAPQAATPAPPKRVDRLLSRLTISAYRGGPPRTMRNAQRG